MGRRPRVDAPGTWHHVMNRGAGHQDIFPAVADRERFLDLLGTIDRRFALETHAYCLMDNHYHLLVRSQAGRLSEAMQHLGARFTRAVNGRRDQDGPVFRGRFHSVLVSDEAHLPQLVRYLHRNPLDLGWRPSLDRYPWSSHAAYLGRAPAPWWLHQRAVLGLFQGDLGSYRAFVEGDEPDEAISPAGSVRPTAPMDVPDEPDVPGVPDPAEVITVVARLTGTSVEELVRSGRGRRNDARLVALVVVSTTTRRDLQALAEPFGFAGASGVRSALARGREILADDAALREVATAAIRELAADGRRPPFAA